VNAPNCWWGLSQEAAARPIDWGQAGRIAWLVLNCVNVLDGGKYVAWPDSPEDATATPAVSPPPPPVIEMPRTPAEAATLLGVPVDADVDEVRAALRAVMANGAHPDQGGDAETAKKYIAAKNLLIDQTKSRQS
jgi:hypothetical protein